MPAIHAIQQDRPAINGRQLCFFAAFLIPVSKFLSAPAALAFFAKGDLLIPALTHYLLQAAILAVILFLASRTDKSFFDLLSDTFGVLTARIVYILYSLYFIFFMLLPILNVERFVYSAFFDTAPYLFAFTPFFFLSGFICTKNLKSFGRCADIAFPLFIVSFVGLMVLSVGEADFTNILPMFGTPFKSTGNAIVRTFGQFSDTALFLPLLGTYRYKKGDGKKIMLSYGLGAVFVLFFLAVFYGIFASLAPKQPYAFAKIGQYFGALSVVGKIRFAAYLSHDRRAPLLLLFSFTAFRALLLQGREHRKKSMGLRRSEHRPARLFHFKHKILQCALRNHYGKTILDLYPLRRSRAPSRPLSPSQGQRKGSSEKEKNEKGGNLCIAEIP